MKKVIVLLVLLLLFMAGCGASPEAAQPEKAQTEIPASAETEASQAPAPSEAAQELIPPYHLGAKMEDFTVTTIDGETVSLYGLLEEKDMVLINFWATWCGPCRNEFPVMEEVYQQYQDRMEILALSTEPADSLDVIREFAQSEGLSFLFAQDSHDFCSEFGFDGIPSSVVVDRFGNICYAGFISPEAECFSRLFDAFIGEDYTVSTPLTDVPPMKPNVAPAPEADLTAALGADTRNPTDVYSWPMLVAEEDGRTVVYATNTGIPDSRSSVTVKLDAKAGDAIAVTFRTSSEAAADLFSIQVNGRHMKYFGGENDWSTYAIPVEADGSYEITLSFRKDSRADRGEDCVWIDSVGVLSGQEAADALDANPVYPVSDAVSLLPAGCQSRKVVFPDDMVYLDYLFPNCEYYVVDSDSVTIHAKLPEGIDPEGAFFTKMFEGTFFGLTQCMTGDGYDLVQKVDCFPESVIPFTAMVMGLEPTGTDIRTIMVFRNEANVEEFVRVFELGRWLYADELGDAAPEEAGQCSYTIRCVDQNGDGVEGVMVQLCDATSCRVEKTDAEGVYVLTSEPYAWEIHILAAPAGYTADSTETVIAAPMGDEITFTLTKN